VVVGEEVVDQAVVVVEEEDHQEAVEDHQEAVEDHQGGGAGPGPGQVGGGAKLVRNPPQTYDGNQERMQLFLSQWDIYWSLNYMVDIMYCLHVGIVFSFIYSRRRHPRLGYP